MTDTVYVVERVALDAYGYAAEAGDLHEWEGTNGKYECRVPVAAFARKADADAHADALTREAWREFGPARFAVTPDAAACGRLRAALRRHGFDPPEFRRYDYDINQWVGEAEFAEWWAGQTGRLTPEAVADAADAAGEGAGLFLVSERPLIED